LNFKFFYFFALCRVPCATALGKAWVAGREKGWPGGENIFLFFLVFCRFAECPVTPALGKDTSLPSVRHLALGKEFFKTFVFF
jgi:hypothetical protein